MLNRLLHCIVALSILAVAHTVLAWSNKEHIQLTRLAIERLVADPSTPPAMAAWLKSAGGSLLNADGERDYFLHQRVGLIPRAVDGIPYWATMPDMAALTDQSYKTIEPFGVGERLLHYIDLEHFMPESKDRFYKNDLSHKPRFEDVPRDLKDPRWKAAGFLPWRVEDCYKKLVAALRAGKLTDASGQYPRDDHAGKWAGYLAHYLEDNTQPQHATADYKSRFYFAGPASKSPNVHWDTEGRLMDDEFNDYMNLREEYWPMLVKMLEAEKDPIESNDPWVATMQVSLISYDALPLIGGAAMAGYKVGGTPEAPQGAAGTFNADSFFHFKGKYLGREMTFLEMKAFQHAWAAKRVMRLYRQAWDEAQKN